jgi:uncharacterized protein
VNDLLLAATEVSPLLDELAAALPGTESVVLLSADGLELAMSAATRPEAAERLVAVAASLHALAEAANRHHGGCRVDRSMVETRDRILVVQPVLPGALLAVLFAAVSDMTGIRETIIWFAGRIGLRLRATDLVPAS